jgi:putative MATE family efflux protein
MLWEETVSQSNTVASTPETPLVHPPVNLERRVIRLAAPVIGENILQTLLGIVDTILVASLGAVALAGVGAALQVVFVLIAGLSALSVGAAVLVAQAVGANEPALANRYARQSMIWSAVVSLPIAFLGTFYTPAIIGLFGLAADVTQAAESYLQITISTVAALIIQQIASGVLRGAGDSRTPMLVALGTNVLNIIVSFMLIYGVLGLPALGVAGAAWGTAIARVVAAGLLLGILWRGRRGVTIGGGGSWLPNVAAAHTIFSIGLPAALEEVLIIVAFATLTPLVATLGTVALAAHRVVINTISLSFLPGIGFGLAATALVGQSIGARAYNEADQIVRIALRWALIWMGGLGILFLFGGNLLMRIFTNDPSMIAIGAAAIVAVALAQPFWAGSFVLSGALRGTGDTRTPLIITSLATWSVVGLGYLSVSYISPSLAAVWAAFLVTGPIEVWLMWRAWRAWQRRHQ